MGLATCVAIAGINEVREMQSPSMLHLVFPDESAGTTGYMGSDCSIGVYDRWDVLQERMC